MSTETDSRFQAVIDSFAGDAEVSADRMFVSDGLTLAEITRHDVTALISVSQVTLFTGKVRVQPDLSPG